MERSGSTRQLASPSEGYHWPLHSPVTGGVDPIFTNVTQDLDVLGQGGGGGEGEGEQDRGSHPLSSELSDWLVTSVGQDGREEPDSSVTDSSCAAAPQNGPVLKIMNHGFYEESDLGIWAMFMLTSIVRLVFVKINIELVLQEQWVDCYTHFQMSFLSGTHK